MCGWLFASFHEMHTHLLFLLWIAATLDISGMYSMPLALVNTLVLFEKELCSGWANELVIAGRFLEVRSKEVVNQDDDELPQAKFWQCFVLRWPTDLTSFLIRTCNDVRLVRQGGTTYVFPINNHYMFGFIIISVRCQVLSLSSFRKINSSGGGRKWFMQ